MALGVFDKNVFDPAVFLCDSDSSAASGVSRRRYREQIAQAAIERNARRQRYMAERGQLHDALKKAAATASPRHDHFAQEGTVIKSRYDASLRRVVSAAAEEKQAAEHRARKTEEIRGVVEAKRTKITYKRNAKLRADDEAIILAMAC